MRDGTKVWNNLTPCLVPGIVDANGLDRVIHPMSPFAELNGACARFGRSAPVYHRAVSGLVSKACILASLFHCFWNVLSGRVAIKARPCSISLSPFVTELDQRLLLGLLFGCAG